jgi:hypothetical protein
MRGSVQNLANAWVSSCSLSQLQQKVDLPVRDIPLSTCFPPSKDVHLMLLTFILNADALKAYLFIGVKSGLAHEQGALQQDKGDIWGFH